MEPTAPQQVRSVLRPEQEVSGPVELCRALFDDALTYYSDYHTAMMEELDLSMSLHHYIDDAGNTKDKRFVQPHSLDLYHLLRHKWGQIDESEVYIDCSAVDDTTDPDLAEDCKFALEHVINDRRLRYYSSRRRMIVGALSARAWGMKVEFDPSVAPFGELVFSSVNPCDLLIAPGWLDMHDVTCPWVAERSKMRVNDVLKMGQYGWVVDGIQPTGTMSHGRAANTAGNVAGQVRVSRTGAPATGTSNQATVTILKFWFRQDPYEETYTETSPTIELDHEDQYFECPSCSHTERAEDLDPMMDYSDEQIPCTACHQAPMERVDFVEQEMSYLKYPEGRLMIVCPELDLVLFDDRWPVKLRSYPYMLLRAYPHPEEPYGQSDVSLLWTMVLIQDATFRAGWEQMIRNTDVIFTPMNGLVDANGDPFLFTDEQGAVAYFADPMAANLTKHFQGSGLSPGWQVFLGAIQQSFQKNMGFNDVNLSGPQLANSTAGALQTAVQQGEIPVLDHINQLNEEQAMFLGVVLDYIIGTWTDERFVRYSGIDGMARVKRVRGTDLPYADVEISVTPKMDQMDAQVLSAFTQWLAFDPPARMVTAQLLNLPPSLVRRYEMARMQYMDSMLAAESAGNEGPTDEPGSGPPAAAPSSGRGKPEPAGSL